MRWVAKLVPRMLVTAALCVRIPDFSQKYNMGDISKELPTHSSTTKNIHKKIMSFHRKFAKMSSKRNKFEKKGVNLLFDRFQSV